MSIISEVPGTIEGQEILLTGLKIAPQGRPILLQKTNLVFPVTVSRRGDGEIAKEFSPQTHKIKKSSMLSRGDKISGDKIWGFCASPVAPKDVTKGKDGRSGRHTGQTLTIKENCFAELIHGWRGDALPHHPKDMLT